MKKTIRIIYLSICGILTMSFMFWAMIQNMEAEHQKSISETWDKMNNILLKDINEYYNNMTLLRNDSLHKINIDSIFENSQCLKDQEIINRLKKK